MSEYCVCGIKLQGNYCPRCRMIFAGQEKVVSSPVLLMERVVVQNTEDTYECDMCGSFMPNKCGSICSGCGWMKPCGLG